MPPTKADCGGKEGECPSANKAIGGVPTVPEWVNEETFLPVVEENVEGFKKIIEFDASLSGGCGENYASIMMRVKVKVELKDGSTKDVAYMIKTIPQGEQGAMMVTMMGLFPKEQSMYGKYLPEFEQIYRDFGKQVTFGPRFYTLKKNPGADYVLLEDLSPRGFKNVNRLEGLDKEHTESVLRILAELHAASAVRFETKGEYDKPFMVGMFTEESRPMLEMMLNSIHDLFLECLATYKVGSKYLDKVKKLQDQSIDLYIEMGKIDHTEFNVINHGDLWANNIMFRYDDDGKLAETILVDFQISRYGSPAVDLFYFLLSSTNLDLKLSHFDYFVKYYHDHLVENLKLLNYPKKVPSLRDLRMQLLKHGFWGFGTISGVMTAILLDPNENANIDIFVAEGDAGKEFKRKMYTNPRYVRHMDAILPWLDERGLLDTY